MIPDAPALLVTPAYVSLDPNAPAGATQAPNAYSTSDLANVRALRDCIITGAVQGWSYTQSTDQMRPADRVWSSGLFRLWMSSTYSGAGNYPTQVTWRWSNDGGTTYVVIATSNLTWNTSLGLINSCDTNSGIWLLWLQAVMRCVTITEAYNAHVTTTGTGVHGLGTMSTQNANAVNVSGGTVQGTTLNNDVITLAQRVTPKTSALTSGAAWDWSTTGPHCSLAPGSTVTAITNPAYGEVKRLQVLGGGSVTITSTAGVNVYWCAGSPVWGANATVISLVAIDPGVILMTTASFP